MNRAFKRLKPSDNGTTVLDSFADSVLQVVTLAPDYLLLVLTLLAIFKFIIHLR
jgi:hypothetical protein